MDSKVADILPQLLSLDISVPGAQQSKLRNYKEQVDRPTLICAGLGRRSSRRSRSSMQRRVDRRDKTNGRLQVALGARGGRRSQTTIPQPIPSETTSAHGMQ